MDQVLGYLVAALRWVVIFILALIWPEDYSSWKGKVVNVVRPDEIQVVVNDHVSNVRLYGIDSPLAPQTFSKEAKKYTAQQVLGKLVEVQPLPAKIMGPWYKPKLEAIDISWGYPRILGIVYVNGTCLNTELLKQGMTWWNKPHVPFELGLKDLQDEARKSKRGLWVDRDPTPPWKFQNSPIFKVYPF